MAVAKVELTYNSVRQSEDLVPGRFSSFNLRANRRLYQELVARTVQDDLYIAALEDILRQHNIELPQKPSEIAISGQPGPAVESLMPDGSLGSLEKVVSQLHQYHNKLPLHVQFRNLSFWGMAPLGEIPTVGSTFRRLLCGSGPKQRLDILKDITGRIPYGKMTLVMGPPGCGE